MSDGPVSGGRDAPVADTALSAVKRQPGGVRLRVRLTPNSSRDHIDGQEYLSDGTAVIVTRVRAVPEDGKANAALVALLAKAAGVGKSRVSIVSGATSRIKIVDIEGNADAILARLTF